MIPEPSSTRFRRRTATLLVALFAVLSVGAASCGSTSSTEIATNDQTDTSADAAAPSGDSSSGDSSSSDSAATTSNEPRESPIGDLLGIPVSDDDAMEEYFGQLGRDAEQKIAVCMRGEGFEYTPVDYSALGGMSSVDFESREFAETQGFGAAPFPSGEMETAFEDFVDPNQEYAQSLTPGEREAYQTALSGELPDFDFESESDDDFFFEPSGCQGEAYEEVFSFGQVFEEFDDEFEAMSDNFEADPRIVQARVGWSRCMSDAGFSYSSPEEAREQFQDRYEPLMRNGDMFEQPDMPEIDPDNPPTEEEMSEMTFDFGPPKIKPEFRAQLDAIIEEEVAVAVAAWDCNVPIRDLEREVQVEMEQEFVDTYGAQIRAALDEVS